MKNLFKVFAILLLSFISLTTYSQTKLNHIAVYVENLKASDKFYKEFLAA